MQISQINKLESSQSEFILEMIICIPAAMCKNECQNGGKCVDLNGSPGCKCPEGYSGSECQNCFDGYVTNPDGKPCDRSGGK